MMDQQQGHKIHVKPVNRCMMEINQQIRVQQLLLKQVKLNMGQFRSKKTKYPKTSQEISDASSVDNP